MRPDLILMDVVMPGLNGFQATRAISRDADTRSIPIILCTSKSQETDKIWGMRQGARDYVVKPVNRDELLRRSRRSADLRPRLPTMARADKLDLRAFQQELATRLASKTAAQVESSRLGLACGGVQWLIRLSDAAEVITMPQVASVPLTKPWFLGVANIRGNLYTVIDFGGFLGREASLAVAAGQAPAGGVRTADGRVEGGHRGRDGCSGLRNLAELAPASPPTDAPTWYGQRWMDADGGAWQEIDLARLAHDPAFLQVGSNELPRSLRSLPAEGRTVSCARPERTACTFGRVMLAREEAWPFRLKLPKLFAAGKGAAAADLDMPTHDRCAQRSPATIRSPRSRSWSSCGRATSECGCRRRLPVIGTSADRQASSRCSACCWWRCSRWPR